MSACPKCGGPVTEGRRFCSRCGAPLAGAPSATDPVPARARKVVTVLFADVSGFTELGERLDPESLHQVIGRWFEGADQVIERHGGTIEKHMGDAVMAVFGVPVVHEDDALRAGRAALEMQQKLADINDELARRWGVQLSVRTGLNTGEVVVGDDAGGESSILGDAVNVAQRLESAAAPGEVLIGAQTARLVRGGAQLERVSPLTLKGKSAPVTAWRLDSVASETAEPPARVTAAFVGRAAELRQLRDAFDDARARSAPRLVTVLGPAGIGKSRLVRAFLDEVRREATSVVGRCLPYGEAITYWAVAEIVRQLAPGGDEAALGSFLEESDIDVQESRLVASRVARAVGFARGEVPVEETEWAIRRLLEAGARRRPLVVAFEDIHWGAPTLLDLIEDLATFATDAPLLLVCLARPELFDERPAWKSVGGGRASVVQLAPLSLGDSAELLDGLADGPELTTDERTRLLAAAEGNPLFLEQMVAMRAELGDEGPPVVAPTIQAVLTARIDGLPAAERELVEAASIEGRTFHRGALVDLLTDEQRHELDSNLASLASRQLVGPTRPDFEGEHAFRFSHILIRDAAYALMPKHRRAELHERHARWLEQRADRGLGEYAELAGYHLEQAFGYRVEVEPAATVSHRKLAAAGGRYLGAAGRTALAREDLPAAIRLLERAIALLPDDDLERVALSPELGTALTEAGELREAERVLDAAVGAAVALGDPLAEAHAVVVRLFGRLQVDTETSAREVRERFDPLLDVFERSADDLGLDRLWRLRALVHWIEARSGEAEAAWRQAAEHARSAADHRGWADALLWLASSACYGPTPVEDGIARCEAIRAQLRGDRRAQAAVLDSLAGLHAMRGEFEIARRLLAERNAILAELGRTMHSAVSHHEAFVALASGDAAGAQEVLEAGYERLAEMGEKALLATTAVMLARAVREQGRLDDAWTYTQVAEDTAGSDDLSAQIGWRRERARVLANRALTSEATRMSAEAVRLARHTDWLSEQADALVAHAEVLQTAGEPQAAGAALREAVALYERKGNTIGVQRAQSLPGVQVPA
jgi:class 3 adenylate cyclase/tetratricopeptide (TPR) repeat protein